MKAQSVSRVWIFKYHFEEWRYILWPEQHLHYYEFFRKYSVMLPNRQPDVSYILYRKIYLSVDGSIFLQHSTIYRLVNANYFFLLFFALTLIRSLMTLSDNNFQNNIYNNHPISLHWVWEINLTR